MEGISMAPPEFRSASPAIDRIACDDRVYLESTDSAVCALTDFRHTYPVTVDADSCIDDALSAMNRRSEHALLVTRRAGAGSRARVVGLITCYDIERKRSHRRPQTADNSTGSPVRVRDLMTPCDELPLVNYQSLESLSAHDLYESFQGTGLTHLLVIERHRHQAPHARGLISRAALTRRLHECRGAIAPHAIPALRRESV